MNELRAFMPLRIVDGALLRPDGIAVGLVRGGAPNGDLMALEALGQAGEDYHRLLLSLDSPLDLYVVDQPPNLTHEIATLYERQEQAASPAQATILGEIADYLIQLGQQSGSRAKQVIWAVTAGGVGPRGVGGLDFLGLFSRGATAGSRQTVQGQAALSHALEKARRLRDQLALLGGYPAPELLDAEAIAQLVYQLADPVRGQRYPLGGSLLERVRRVVTAGSASLGGTYGIA